MTICVYLGANPGNDPVYMEKARELGQWIGRQGYRLTYGGSKVGLMGALAKSAMKAGATVIGVEPQFFVDSEKQLDGLDELIVTETMEERKTKLIELSDAFLAFPGGTGTLDEIAEIMCAVSLDLVDAPCLVYNLNGYYDHLEAQLDWMTHEGMIHPANRARIRFVRTLEELQLALQG